MCVNKNIQQFDLLLFPSSRQEMFEFDKELAKKDDDVFHFVAYVPIQGRLYELDGLKEGPVDLGECEEGDWLKSVKPVLDKRMQRCVCVCVCDWAL